MKEIKTRIAHTHDTEENWNKCTTFVPMDGEIIVYDKDENHGYQRFKIGDGTTVITNLPFATDHVLESIAEEKNNVLYIDSGRITEY